jgi:hypothetical protein
MRYVDLNSPIDIETSGLRDQRTQFDFPDRENRPGGNRKRILLMLLAISLIGGWQARGRITLDARLPAAPAPPKPAGLPAAAQLLGLLQKNSGVPNEDHEAVRRSAPEPPEVTIRNFRPTKKQSAKIAPGKRNSTKSGAALTIPDEAHLPKPATTSALTSPTPVEQPIVLPLSDADVASAVAATSPPPTPKPKEAGFWQRVSGKLWFGGKKARTKNR